MYKIFSIAFLVFFALNTTAQKLHLIPEPVSVKQPKIASDFKLSAATKIVLKGKGTVNSAAFLNDYLQQFYGIRLKVVNSNAVANAIVLNNSNAGNSNKGSYQLGVNERGVVVKSDNAEGIFYAIQTLIQLLPVPADKLNVQPGEIKIPHVSVTDAPRFAYRGMHLDVGRHFLPISFVKKYIDYLALHKFNRFHWHLTEDQGWRIEIKKYPRLTSVGGWRNGTIVGHYPASRLNDNTKHGGFFTQEEIKEVVKYAKDRFIDIIPEIEMPGHGSAAIAAYPQLSCFPEEPSIKYFRFGKTWNDSTGALRFGQAWAGDSTGKQVQQTWGVFDDVFCAGKENTFQFLQDVLDEVMALFPSKYIHIGGDECPKENWKKCNHCQKRMKENNLKDEHELQSYFVQRMEKYLNKRGKTLIGWDEILEGGLAPNAIVMSWRGEQGGVDAARQKHFVIMTPDNPVYFDYGQSLQDDSITIDGYNPLDSVYAYEPIPRQLSKSEAKFIMGAQANVWTEYMKYPSKVEYMIFPRMSALSEVLWSPKEKRDKEVFLQKLQTQFKRYDLWKASYHRAFLLSQ